MIMMDGLQKKNQMMTLGDMPPLEDDKGRKK